MPSGRIGKGGRGRPKRSTPELPPLPPAPASGYPYQFTTAGKATFAIPLPSGFATAALQIGALTTQTNILTTWGDGSIRHAELTTTIVTPGTYIVGAITPHPGGSITPAIPVATVTVTVAGTPYTATMPTAWGSFDATFYNGALMREARSVKSFSGATGAAAQLRAVFDCRVYADDTYRVSIDVRNHRNHTDANTLTYDVTMSVGGGVLTDYPKTSKTHSYLAHYRGIGTNVTEATIVPDFTSYYQAKATRDYLPSITNATPDLVGSFDILQKGDLQVPFSLVGDRPDIGLLPQWCAHYLVHKTDAQKAYVLKMGENPAGSISCHVDNTSDTLFQLASASASFDLQLSDRDGFTGPAGGGSRTYPYEVGPSHIPCLAYLPWLLTGDRFYLDELKYWANANILCSPWLRGSTGIITNNQVRDIAWAMRDLANAIAWSPDADTDKSYFAAILAANTADLNTKAAAERDTVLGGSQLGQPAAANQQMFMQAYVAWGLDHVVRQGFTAPTYLSRILTYWNSLYTAHPAFDRRYVPSYKQYLIRPESLAPFADHAALFTYNLLDASTDVRWSLYNLSNGSVPTLALGSYAVEARVLIALAMKYGLPNAAAHLGFLDGYNNAEMLPYLQSRAQYAIAATGTPFEEEETETGPTYYVSPSGVDAASRGTLTAPWRTLTYAIEQLHAGDTLYVRGGTYTENLTGGIFRSGTSWSNTIRIAKYASETVWLRPTGSINAAIWIDANVSYVDFDGINVDSSLTTAIAVWFSTNNGNDPHHIRFQNAEVIAGVTGGGGSILLGNHTTIGATGSHQILNNVIHGGGRRGLGGGYTGNNYGVYVSGPNNLVEGNTIYDMWGAGLQIYNSSGDPAINNIIRNNRIRDVAGTEEVGQLWGIIVAADNNLIYNNLIYNIDNGVEGDGIYVYNCDGNKLFNNTVYDVREYGVLVDATATNTQVKNTIAYLGAAGNYLNSGSGTTTATNLVASNPLFVNAGAGDFRLQVSSPAVNTGTTLPEVTTDIVGVARPQGAAYDIGAYERV